jgi:pyridoxal phosphate enzyme (YggS family)
VADLITGLDAERVAANLAAVRNEIERAGREPAEVEILAAVKYVAAEEIPVLAEAGLTLLGENRAQDLRTKVKQCPGRFTWDFIGHLQSRKVKQVAPLVRLVHSVASDSVLAQLERHGTPETQVLVEVNVAGEESKSGVAPADLPAFLERCPVTVVGLMTMPPFAEDPEASRRYFAALRELAHELGLRHLSMGTTQDFAVAAQEGATIVRIGSRLYR